ncbi:IPT/TIG domain-containing protein [Streptomyces sp. BRA346]|uniref:IPT/TIG domain-containing protein n=1 Tax=Streptomyces sp. BRA346 TaxID=2878199 RepID=UPI0040649785
MAPNGRAYVTNEGSSDVSVIDTATNTLIATVPVVYFPRGVAVAPNGRAYVANFGANVVSVIDTTSNTVITTIPVGLSPFQVAVAPNGHVYVTNRDSGTVSVIDTTTNTVITTIPVGTYMRGIAVAPNGRAYVANQLTNDVSVIDTATNTVFGSPIPVGNSPAGVAVAPNGRAYVANRGSGTVSVIDTTTNTVITTIPVGGDPREVAFTPNGHAFVTNDVLNIVSVIDTATNTVITTIPVGNGPVGVAVAPNGSVYVVNSLENNVGVLAPPTLTGISPVQGSAAGGTQVTITGTDLFGATVTIGGQPATNLFYNLAGTALIATTPPGTPGLATVTVTNQIGSASLPGGYTYVAAATTLTATPAVIRLNLTTGQFYIPTLSATLTDQVSGAPIPSQTITFTANPVTGPVTLGTATTDVGGTATLTNTTVLPTLITANHYTATFTGSPGHPAATTTAPLVYNPI